MRNRHWGRQGVLRLKELYVIKWVKGHKFVDLKTPTQAIFGLNVLSVFRSCNFWPDSFQDFDKIFLLVKIADWYFSEPRLHFYAFSALTFWRAYLGLTRFGQTKVNFMHTFSECITFLPNQGKLFNNAVQCGKRMWKQ